MMRSLATSEAARILVIMPSWVGDVTMATPVLRCVRKAFPEAWIGVLVRSWLREILDGCPHLDEVITYDPKVRDAGLRGGWAFVRELRSKRFDLALALPHSFRAGLLARLSGAKRRVGYNRGDRGFLLTDSMRPPRDGDRWRPVPKSYYYLDLCKAAGIAIDSTRPELFCREEDTNAARQLLDRHGVGADERLILINPGAKFGSSKCWLPQRFAEVADLLVERHAARVALVCGPGEEHLVQKILDCGRTRPINFSETFLPLGTLMALVERCDLMVTNDTGPRHFAVAFDKPTVVIMGSTDPRHTACNLEKTVVVRKDVPCGPCHKRACPTDHLCMKELTATDVLEAADKLIRTHWNEHTRQVESCRHGGDHG